MLNAFDLQNRDLLDGIQGNILKAHGRHHTANLFIRCDDGKQNEAKAWIKSLVEGEDALIYSGYAQLRSNMLWKEAKVDSGTFACIHISASGYDYLFGENARLSFLDSSFQNGMKNAELNDPAVEDWEEKLRADNHFMLLLANVDKDAVAKLVGEIEQRIMLFARFNTVETGEALLNEEGAGIEHFGYVDGISQPLFFEDEWTAYKAVNNIKNEKAIEFDPRADTSLVLIKDPLVSDNNNAWGSYFVFRKLEQDVKGFKNAEKNLGIELGLQGEDAERVGAMIVGRFEDGTPVQLSNEAGIIHSAVINNFDYDTANEKCPYHAHIRKTNPRVGPKLENKQVKSNHVMARRGIPFGTRTDGPNDGRLSNKPEKDVGLLFMSYQASIKDQFEVVQAGANNLTNGIDPVLGQGDRTVTGLYPTQWGSSDLSTRIPASFDQFVHMKGGEYFFAPSMKFLKTIDII